MERVQSRTYKLFIPGENEQRVYFTIADDPPRAFFVNSKEMSSFQWVTALMTSYSRQLEAGIPIDNIVHDMKEAFDPNGRYIIPDGSGREVNGIIHHLGLVLEEHLK